MTSPTRTRSERITATDTFWNEYAEAYQMIHAEQLSTAVAMWSVFAIPETEIGALGDVAGKDIVELGCGGAQFSIGLARQGARCTGVDLSREMLAHADQLLADIEAAEGVRPNVQLVSSDVESLDLPDASFDIAFSDYGASMYADPYQWVPEAARVLRPGGRLAFSAMTPFLELCWPTGTQKLTTGELQRTYFDLHEIHDRTASLFNLPYGEWVRLFRRSGFDIVDLIETQPRPDQLTTEYRNANQVEWARKWPAEMIWVLDRR